MASPKQFFFEIPMYRCTMEAHTRLMEREKNDYIRYTGADPLKTPDAYAGIARFFDNERWYPWRFNEVVGWIRLYRYGSQILGELWLVQAKRLLPRGRKNYAYDGDAFEIHISPGTSDVQIADEVLNELRTLQKGKRFRSRFIDLECFEMCAPVINWGELLPPSDRHV